MLVYLSAWLHTHTRNQRGASAVEYALLLAGAAAVIIGVSIAFGKGLSWIFGETLKNNGVTEP